MRHYIKFYIDRKGQLRAIWYNERERRCNGEYWCKGSITNDLGDEPKYAVRSVRLCRSCDKYAINKVAYWNSPDTCMMVIDSRIKRHKKPTLETLTDENYYQLSRCPGKYIDQFFNYLRTYLTEDEVDYILRRFIQYVQNNA